MTPADPAWLQFVDAEIEPIVGVVSGLLIGGLCTFAPSLATRVYQPIFGRFTWAALVVFDWGGLAYAASSILVLAVHVIG